MLCNCVFFSSIKINKIFFLKYLTYTVYMVYVYITINTNTMTTPIKSIIENKLNSRTIEQLKNDAKVAMTSNEEGSNMIFVMAMNILESKLSESEYESFENSL